MAFRVGDRVKVALSAGQVPPIREALTMTGGVVAVQGARYDIEVDDSVEGLKVIREIPEASLSPLGQGDPTGNFDQQGRQVTAFGRDGQAMLADEGRTRATAEGAVGQGGGNPAVLVNNPAEPQGKSGQSDQHTGGDPTPTA